MKPNETSFDVSELKVVLNNTKLGGAQVQIHKLSKRKSKLQRTYRWSTENISRSHII